MSGPSFTITRCARCHLAIRREGLSYVDGAPLWSHTAEAVRQGAAEGIPTRHRARPADGARPLRVRIDLDADLPQEIADRGNAEARRIASRRPGMAGSSPIRVDGRTVGVVWLER